MSETLLYEGKAKRVYETGEEGVLLHRYKDDATAFDGKKRGSWAGKGKTNATMSAALFKYLESRGVPTHFVGQPDEEAIKTKKLDMLPVEVIVRNVAAGSLAKRIGYEEGTPLKAPIVELCLKDDDLGDPMLNWYHFRELGVADEDLKFCEELGLKVNELLYPFFDEKGVTLVDFKVEVGRDEGRGSGACRWRRPGARPRAGRGARSEHRPRRGRRCRNSGPAGAAAARWRGRRAPARRSARACCPP